MATNKLSKQYTKHSRNKLWSIYCKVRTLGYVNTFEEYLKQYEDLLNKDIPIRWAELLYDNRRQKTVFDILKKNYSI